MLTRDSTVMCQLVPRANRLSAQLGPPCLRPLPQNLFPLVPLQDLRVRSTPGFCDSSFFSPLSVGSDLLQLSPRQPPFPRILLLHALRVRPEDQDGGRLVQGPLRQRLVRPVAPPELVLGHKDCVAKDIDDAKHAAQGLVRCSFTHKFPV